MEDKMIKPDTIHPTKKNYPSPVFEGMPTPTVNKGSSLCSDCHYAAAAKRLFDWVFCEAYQKDVPAEYCCKNWSPSRASRIAKLQDRVRNLENFPHKDNASFDWENASELIDVVGDVLELLSEIPEAS